MALGLEENNESHQLIYKAMKVGKIFQLSA